MSVLTSSLTPKRNIHNIDLLLITKYCNHIFNYINSIKPLITDLCLFSFKIPINSPHVIYDDNIYNLASAPPLTTSMPVTVPHGNYLLLIENQRNDESIKGTTPFETCSTVAC